MSLQTPSRMSLEKSKKRSQSRPKKNKSEEKNKDDSNLDGINSDSIASKLLLDIAAKYRHMERQNLI